MLLEVGLVGVHHAVEPWQELLGAVVRVQDDGDAVARCDGTDVVCTSHGAGDGCLLALVGNALVGTMHRQCCSFRERHGPSMKALLRGLSLTLPAK